MRGNYPRFNGRRALADDAGVKLCNGCSRRLSVAQFHKNKAMHDGLASRCKECQAAQHRRSREMRAREETEALSSPERCDLCAENGHAKRGPFLTADGIRVCARHLKKRVKERLSA